MDKKLSLTVPFNLSVLLQICIEANNKAIQVSKSSNKSEQFNIQFLGMKFNSTNPGKRTITILVILLIFFLALVLLLKAYVLPAVATFSGAKAIGVVASKTSAIKKWFGVGRHSSWK